MERKKSSTGFTLLEVLVSLLIVSLVVTVYFQLISSGMKLEYKSRQHMQRLTEAYQKFESLIQKDVRSEDFQWKGEEKGYKWSLEIKPLEIKEQPLSEETSLKLSSELYQFIFLYSSSSNNKPIKFIRYVHYSPNFFSLEFKQDHFDMSFTSS